MKCKFSSVVFSILLLAFAAGCLFDPREPDNPGGEEEECWTVPNTPKDAFLNLKCGFEASSNSSYERSLYDEEFIFNPRAQDSILLLNSLGYNVFADWTKAIEVDMLSSLKAFYVGKRFIQFGDEEMNFESENVDVKIAWFEGPYIIVLKENEAKIDTFSGKARFYIIQSTQGWVLRRWEDTDVNGNYPTSGWLRGTSRTTS